MQAVNLPLEDFPPDHPNMGDVLRMLDCETVVLAQRDPEANITGLCYWLATANAAQFGGKMIIGWMIQWVPGVYISAMHHAIVRRGDELFDPSAPEVPSSGHVTTFVPDERFQPDLNWPVEHETRHYALLDDPDVRVAHEAYRENNKLMRRHHSIMKRIPGVSWSPSKGWIVPPGFRRENYVKDEDRVRASFGRLHQARRRILNRYFPS